MKKDITITTLLGITHPEAARLFGVSLSQWSMYSSGRRSLPTHAAQLLGDVLAYMKEAEVSAKARPEPESGETGKQLEALLNENKYQQMRLDREIVASERKREAQFKRKLLSGFLEKRSATKQEGKRQLPDFRLKPAKPLKLTEEAKLVVLQHRRGLLAVEEKMLEEKLEKLGQAGVCSL